MTVSPLAAALIGATIGAASIAYGEPGEAPKGAADSPLVRGSEAGLLCSLAFYHTVAGVGRRCLAGQDAPFQAAVAAAIARLEAHAQTGEAMSRAELDLFAAAIAGDGRPAPEVCDEEGFAIYRSARDGGLEPIEAEVERQLARPGPPRWGVCR